MEDNLCKEKHKQIDESLDRHNRRLDNHSNRLDKLEQFQSGTVVKIENLIQQIQSLVSTIKWGTGLTISSLLAFFIWYIQKIGG